MTASPALAIVLVHYHAARSLRAAVASLARDLDASGLGAEWRIVDNGSTPQERAELEATALPVLPGAGNHGFAAGVNAGVNATAAPVVLIANPDVSVLPGCVRALVAELEAGAGAVAPRLYWDQDRRFLLPPGEARTRAWDLLSLAAARWPRCAAVARRRWRRDARRHWEARGSIASIRLSGAMLAFTRVTWQRVGPFDEGFRLYFEETDWLLRLEQAGLPARQVASAEAVHGFAHSTRHQPLAGRWFEESARRFRELHYGRRFSRLHDGLARRLGAARIEAAPLTLWSESSFASLASIVATEEEVWIELSPNAVGYPAAGERVRAADLPAWRPPCELMRGSGLSGMSLGVVTGSGRELGRWWILPGA